MSTAPTRRFVLVGFAATAGLAACAAYLPPPPLPELSYAHLPPIRLNVGQIEVNEIYEPPLKPPNVEHLFPTTPQTAARRWAADRLQAAGGEGRAVFVIRRASVIETKLPRAQGLRAMFSNEQSERYDGRLEVAIEIRNDRGFQDAFATAQADRSRTLPENVTLYGRERAFLEITEGLMKDVNDQLEVNIRQYLSRYLR
ncbi:MAG: hypothetical protein EXQ85_08130 [Alphaproteobacteria bacterium]|nr:hypothetical protein [Alphaproteobacteria bacterium]